MILQLAVMQIGFNLLFPKNFVDICRVFLEIAKFDVVPSQKLLRDIFDFAATEKMGINPRLARLNYDSLSFSINAGTVLILLQFCMLTLLLTLLLLPCKRSSRAIKLRIWLQSQIMWNRLIDLLQLAEIGLLIAGTVYMNSRIAEGEKRSGDVYDEVVAIFTLILYISFFVCIVYVLIKFSRSESLNKDVYIKTYGSFTPEMRTRSKTYLAYPFLETLLRILFVLLIFTDDTMG